MKELPNKISFLFFIGLYFLHPVIAAFPIYFSQASAQEIDALKQRQIEEPASVLIQNSDPLGAIHLKQRVEDLEAQVHDLQIEIGRLESLIKNNSGMEPIIFKEIPDDNVATSHKTTLEKLELQVQALSLKTDQLAQKINVDRTGVQDTATSKEQGPFETSAMDARAINSAEGVSASEVSRSSLLDGASQDKKETNRPPNGDVSQTKRMVILDPLSASNDPVQEYERAYGFLIQQNFDLALSGFRNFIKSHPKDPLMPHALYWLGETHYAQSNYRDAAEAFDLLVQGYGTSPKAPDSLLKRGMALAALGKKADACEALSKLSAKYPSAAANLKTKIEGERNRIGCPPIAR